MSMTTGRKIAVVLGVVLVSVGLSMFFSPGLAPELSSSIQYTVAALAAIQGLRIASARRQEGRLVESDTGDPEIPHSIRVPGDDFDERLDMFYSNLSRFKRADNRQRIKERLERVAVDVLTHERDCTREEAEEMLENGTWTDVPHARNFFTESAGQGIDVFNVRAVFSSEPPYRKRTRITVDTIADMADVVDYESDTSEDQASTRNERRSKRSPGAGIRQLFTGGDDK